MATTNYCSLGSDPYQDVPRSIGGKLKPVSGRINVFRRSSWLSIAESESMPSVDPLESNTSSSEEVRDEVSSFISDDKKENKTSSNSTPRKASPHRGDRQPSNEVNFNTFEFDPFWDFEDTGEENKDVKTQTRDPPEVAETPYEVLETDKDTQARSVSAAEKTYHDYQSHVNGPIIDTRPAALKIDQWSKALVRNKKQFKYHSFINEKRISRKKKSKSKAKSAVPSVIKTVATDGNGIEQTKCRPKNKPSFKSVKLDGVEFRAFDNGPVANNPDLFHPKVRGDSQCKEGALIGPLRPKTTLHLTVQERPKDSWDIPEFSKRDQPPCDNLTLESLSREEQNNAPDNVITAVDKSDHKQNKISENEGQELKTKDDIVDDTSACPSDGDYSSVFSGKTENLPLLRAWGMKTVDCNNCGSNKARKKIETKKKRAEIKKKFIEDLWERKHFYWKYESIDDNRKKQLEELDTLLIKIAPEANDTPVDGFVEMPLGFQLSTITEGDEDLTACLSPRSTLSIAKILSLGAGCVQQDGKVLLKISMESILDSINKDVEVSHSEDEIEIFPHDPHPKDSNIEKNEIPEAKLSKPSKPERPKTSRRSRHRRSAVKLKNNEIEVPDMCDDASSLGDSKGEISDITEDCLHIPLSSPLYTQVLQAYREAETQNCEAETQNDGNKEKVKHCLAYI